jgi:hypothetical protein
MIGIGAAADAAAALREWILETIAAAAGGHRLALLQTGIAATPHSGSHVATAIINRARRRRRRRRRDKCHREQRRGRRGTNFQKLFHLVFPLLVSSKVELSWDAGDCCAIGLERK